MIDAKMPIDGGEQITQPPVDLDVTFTDYSGQGLNESTILDPGAEADTLRCTSRRSV